MTENQQYCWDDLVGRAEHVDMWHPNAIPTPYRLPGLSPHELPPYGITQDNRHHLVAEMSRRSREKYNAAIKESLSELTSTIYIGEAALWQSYNEDPRSRLFTNIGLMELSLREQHTLQIVPFDRPLPPNTQVPFAIYTRKNGEPPVLTRDIDGQLYHSTDTNRIHEKWEIFKQLGAIASTELESQEMIRRVVTRQRHEL